ncbi:MAG TPA: phage/plasmid replication protein, II/X family [Noviherbaspirillum sp.]|nr:phage/plasmid replication protein, II/X family [Noviherbaspirillum sp.]
MIDWVTATLPFSSAQKFAGGFVRSIDADGVVQWQTEKRLPVVGSHDAHFHIVSKGEGFINISGNPSKFLQGHNLFGSDNLLGLVTEVMKRICKALNVPIRVNDYLAWRTGNYVLQRVDIAYMYSLESRANVRAWLRAAEYQSKSRHGRPISKGGTVYWGKHSRRWAMKAYGKADELTSTKDHRLPQTIPNGDLLLNYAEDKLRVELVLRSMQLKDLSPLDTARHWTDDLPAKLHGHFLESIDMSNQFTLTETAVQDLPARLVAVYKLWKNGEDLRAMYPKNTFYRYRRQLLEHDIDIAVVQPKASDNVIQLIRALRPQAVAHVPDWAKGTDLYFDASCKKAA